MCQGWIQGLDVHRIRQLMAMMPDALGLAIAAVCLRGMAPAGWVPAQGHSVPQNQRHHETDGHEPSCAD